MPIRDDILESLISELKGIKTDRGFSTTIKKVSRDFESYEQCQSFEMPALYVMDDGSDEKLGYYKQSTDIYVLRKMEITLVGYVRATKNISRVFDKLFADILKKIEAIDLGNNVRDVSEAGATLIFTMKHNLIFQMPISIVYFYDKTNP